jgi:hypothetical protein
MKTQWISIGLAVALTVAGSGCLAKCRFEKRSEAKGSEYSSLCYGSIVACNPGDTNCRNTLKIECDDNSVYHGPYTVKTKNNYVRYTASNWHGHEDAPSITTEIPQSDKDVVRAWVKNAGDDREDRDDDRWIQGSCRYDFLAN